MPKVSIIIPVFNSEKYLEKCIKSVVNQSINDIEIIIVNDGSTDESLKICKEYKDLDDRIKLFSIKNSGAGAARNIGLEHAKGEYVGFVDSDDWIELDMFEILYKKALINNSDIVSCNFYRNYNDKIIKNNINFKNGIFKKNKIIDYIFPKLICSETFISNIPVTMVTKIFKNDIIINNNISFDQKMLGGQDLLFSRTCIMYANSIYFMNDSYFYHYRYNCSSRTNTYLADSWDIYRQSIKSYNKVTNKYEGFDFSRQLKYFIFKSAMTAINYQTKPGGNENFYNRYKSIKEICHDNIITDNFGIINWSKQNIKNKLALLLIKNKMAMLLLILGTLQNYIFYKNK